MKLLSSSRLLPGVLFATALLSPAWADVTMPTVFGSHMVLQQDARLPVWGWAEPNEKIKVTLGGSSLEATAGTDGAWRVEFPPQPRPEKDAPCILTVAGHNTLTYQDVLIGDVWIASGQSNMAFGILNEDHAAEAIAKADQPKIRLFRIPCETALEPRRGDAIKGEWLVCTPENLKATSPQGFSAAAFFFGSEIVRTTGHPVGLIGTYWGGTPAQAWTSLTGLEKEPSLAGYVAEHQKFVTSFPTTSLIYAKLKTEYDAANKEWFDTTGRDYYKATEAWSVAATAASAAGQPAPPKPKQAAPRALPPIPPDGGQMAPTTLFNAMVAPLIPFAIKGVIWYQGEANVKGPKGEYAILFSRLISDWREKWGQGDFPFLFVQLANVGTPATAPTPKEGIGYPLVREGQLRALSLPATGMAVAIDIGNPFNIHPKDKLDIGLRLALAARHVAYGEELVFSGPIYQSMKIEGNKIRLTFTQTGSGLKMGMPPWTPTGKPPVPPTELTGFGIAGADKKWVWGKAVIEGDTVVVSSNEVAAPVAVRYGWASCPPCNLYNLENLPASPFRTDDWN